MSKQIDEFENNRLWDQMKLYIENIDPTGNDKAIEFTKSFTIIKRIIEKHNDIRLHKDEKGNLRYGLKDVENSQKFVVDLIDTIATYYSEEIEFFNFMSKLFMSAVHAVILDQCRKLEFDLDQLKGGKK